VAGGATLQLHRTSEFLNNVLNKVVTMSNATFAVEANGLTNLFAGPVVLTGSNSVTMPAATGLNLQGNVTGASSVTVTGPGLLVISGAASHTGGTTLNGAVLQVDGSLGAGSLLVNGISTIAGNGTIADAVTVPSGSTLAAGDAGIGALTINNSLVLSAGSTNVVEVNKDLSTNDVVRGLTSVTYGGALVLSNLSSSGYAPGDNFKIFNAASYNGMFNNIIPATPALGLIWVTNNLATNGTLSVAVLPNPIPLFALSASSLVSTNVNVLFTAAVESGTAQDPSNYLMSTSNQVLTATLVSPTNVLLGLDSPITNNNFTVRVKNVKDLAFVPNVVATTNVAGIALGFLESFSVAITNGSAFAYSTQGVVKVYSDGSDIFGTADHFQFVYTYVTNDFDLAVMLQSLLITDPAAKAGLMIRDTTDATFPLLDDRHYLAGAFTADATRNNNFSQYREAQGATAVAPAAPRPGASYPTNWLRLKRTGSIVSGYSSSNGLDWAPFTAVDSATNAPGAYPSVVRVGLAVTAHNAAATTEALFSNFGKAVDRGVLSVTQSGSDVIVSWNAGAIGATLQTAPNLTSPVTWTSVPGSTTTNSMVFPISGDQSYFRLSQ